MGSPLTTQHPWLCLLFTKYMLNKHTDDWTWFAAV